MTAVERARLPLVDDAGRPLGEVTIALLPSLKQRLGVPALLDLRGEPSVDDDLEPVQLIEGFEYVYVVSGAATASCDKPEVFVADDDTGSRGRLKTRLATGRVAVTFSLAGRVARPIAFEVRSTKLGYLDDYRAMLESIAELGADLLLERFAPSEQRLSIDGARDARGLYQRFVFLRGLLESERLAAALRKIASEPYVSWEEHREHVPAGRGARGSDVVRQLTRVGPRQPWPNAPTPALRSLPRFLEHKQADAVVDNVPNRFVLHAVREWRALVLEMGEALTAEGATSAAAMRGRAEVQRLDAQLDAVLRAPVFADVGPLEVFPQANPVLQRKEGYREVMHAYLVVQLGAQLAWEGGEDVFGGGQRNVATLYEYWVFLELAKIVSSMCDAPLDLDSLVADGASGLQLVLRRKRAHAVRGTFSRHGRHFRVELCFNQQFSRGHGTWTRTLRPDCSLHIVPLDAGRGEDDVWLHFDAKYRADRVEDVINDDDEDRDDVLVAKSDDLYKMHTYRDAIVRAAGAFVVFPGTDAVQHGIHDEILPGLGAFPLRPSRDGTSGTAAIRAHLAAVFDHVAQQGSKHERERYWRRRSRAEPASTSSASASFLTRPPADAQVLLGYVKSKEHAAWIAREGLYNLRADPGRRGAIGLHAPELGCEHVILYGAVDDILVCDVVGEPRLLRTSEMAGYPSEGSHSYFCLPVQPRATPEWLTADVVRGLLEANPPAEIGAPVCVAWRDVMSTADG